MRNNRETDMLTFTGGTGLHYTALHCTGYTATCIALIIDLTMTEADADAD